MAIFKSKKTYIKRYASKNSDKKITFAPAVKATFNGTAIRDGAQKPKSGTSSRTVAPDTLSGGGNTTGAIRYGQPDEKHLELFTDKKPEVIRNKVVSGPAEMRPAPAPKPDLTNVKADEYVRPIVDTNPAEHYVSGADVTDSQADIKDENMPDASLQKAAAVAQKAVSEPAEADRPTEERDADNEQTARRQRNDMGKVVSVLAKVVLLLVIISTIGVVGYRYSKVYSERIAALNTALSTHYPPEDYIYPQTPDSVKAVNDASREEAYNQAMANAYVPSRSEVPGLYKYDYVKTCYLTFDDGPSGSVTESILNTLKEYNVPATFFVVGKNAEAYPDLLRRIEAEGHSIGNHSYSHNYEYMYSGDPQFDHELYSCRNAINRILGKDYDNMLYRFPGGSFEVYKQFYIYNIESLGYQHVDWNALTGDSEMENPDEEYIMNALRESTNNGTKEDIVLLMHDAGAKQITADTLPKVIEYLKSKNYVFKAVKNSNIAQ